MPNFEVAIVYKGQASYFVEAPDEEAAETLACARFRNGDNGDPCGTEYEAIENLVTSQVPIFSDDVARVG